MIKMLSDERVGGGITLLLLWTEWMGRMRKCLGFVTVAAATFGGSQQPAEDDSGVVLCCALQNWDQWGLCLASSCDLRLNFARSCFSFPFFYKPNFSLIWINLNFYIHINYYIYIKFRFRETKLLSQYLVRPDLGVVMEQVGAGFSSTQTCSVLY